MRSILTLSSLALLLLLVISTAHAQCTNTADGNFTLPAWGSDCNYQKYGQYVPASPGLTGDRLWQISLCQTATNGACQNGKVSAPVSYIYQLNRNDGSAGSCDMGLSLFGGWSTSYALDNNGNLVTSLNGTFTNAALNRVAVVALICGTSALTPVTYPGQPNQWYTYPNSAQSVWTWDMVFSTNAIPSLCGNNPPPPPNPTPNPPPPPPAPAGTCQLNGAYFKLPSFNGTVQQWVPSAPELNGARNWQVSPCAPTLPTCNPTNGNVIESFVFESTPSTGTCSMQLNVQATNWTQAYGGINALFTNLAGNRVANVTVSCGPIAELQAVDTAPSGQGWNTHLLPNSVGQVWVWDMWFTSSLVPGC